MDDKWTRKCANCTATCNVASGSVRDVQKETGWTGIMLATGGMAWWCPECFDKFKAAATPLVELLQNQKEPQFYHWGAIYRIVTKE